MLLFLPKSENHEQYGDRVMSWHKITRPLTLEIDPEVVRIGKIVWDRFVEENKPEGFAMFHASRGSEDGLHDTRLVYLTPLATEICREALTDFTLEPCGVPACNEPDMAYVFGDPRMMGELKDKYVPEEEAPVAQAAS
jgi:hypothetical protein